MKWYSREKGYGFIQPEDGLGDVFVHQSELRRSRVATLDAHLEVEFDVLSPPGGHGRRRATNVRVLGGQEAVPAPPEGSGKAGPQPSGAPGHRGARRGNLYVGGLPFKFNDDDVAELFARRGFHVRTAFVMRHTNGSSKGYAFVQLPGDELARAIELLDGLELEGRRLKVAL